MHEPRNKEELGPGARQWLASRLQARELDLQRMVVRREAWSADVETHAGSRERYFLRIDRAARAGQPGRRGLKRETALIRYLNTRTDIPTQRIIDWSDEHCIAIQSFEPGRADLDQVPRDLQHRILDAFMEILGDLHRIDTAQIDLPEFERPATPEAHSLLELDAVAGAAPEQDIPDSTSLLGSFGMHWLQRHVPREVERTSLLQGDTGAGNFMFNDAGITAIADWEWAHFGDPLEDLGNVWLRDVFTPSAGGDLTPYFQRYAAHAGIALDQRKITYYLIHQLVRTVVSLPGLTRKPHWRSPIALNLGYQAVCDLLLCEALGLYHHIEPDFEPLPRSEAPSDDALYRVVAEQLDKGVAPQLEEAYAHSMALGAANVVRYLERLRRDGPRADALELEGINRLLGEHHGQLASARRALHHALESSPSSEEERAIIAHCWGVASRNRALMEPLASHWQHCRLAKVEL